MGLYDNRLRELSEPRRSRRVAARGPTPIGVGPFRRRVARAPIATATVEAKQRPSMDIQSLLFGRDSGWTASNSKDWAKSHGFKHGKVDVTDQYVRIRQFDPNGLQVKRTITLGRGIRAVVAREEEMKTKRRRRTHKAKEATVASPRRRRAHRTREAAPVATESKRRRKRSHRTREATSVVKETKRRRVRRVAPRSGQVMEAKRTKRSRAAAAAKGWARRRRSGLGEAWHGDSAGHAKAAKKGWSKRRRNRRVKEAPVATEASRSGQVMEAKRRSPRRRRTREFAYEEAKRPRRRRHAREQKVTETRSRRRRYSVGASRRKSTGGMGSQIGQIALGAAAAGASFLILDWVDRILATYNPALPADKKPTDKFTSDGAGTLANTLNVAAPPGLKRIGATLGGVILPAVASLYVDNKHARAALEGAAVGAGVKAFQLLWNNVLAPMLGPKKDATPEQLQKSMIARLYPAEVAAKLNLENDATIGKNTSAVYGSLSGTPQSGVGAPDVGPFAVGGPSPYPDAVEALRAQAGMAGPSPYPSAGEALRQEAGVGYPYRPSAPFGHYGPVATQWRNAHPAYRYGYGNFQQWSNRWAGQGYQPQYQIQSPPQVHHHHHCMARAKAAYPTYTDAQLHAWCQAHPFRSYPYLYEAPAAAPNPYGLQGYSGVGADPAGAAPPPPPPPDAAPPPPEPVAPSGPGFAPAPPPPAPMPPAATAPPPGPPTYAPGPPAYAPGPGSTVGPGPDGGRQTECACLGDSNPFLGFIGDAEEKDSLFNSSSKSN